MNSDRDVVFTGAVRTAIGTFGGSLAAVPPTELGARVIREAVTRSGIEPEEVGHVVFGQVIHTEPKDMYLARVAAMGADIPKEVPAMTLNRLCGSGLQAIVSAAQLIRLGDADIAVAGGAESMSRAPHVVPDARFGKRLGNAAMIDMLTSALTDPFGNGHMGVTAENVAADAHISREQQDALALNSHRRAVRALDEGRFRDQVLPIEVTVGRDKREFSRDEHARSDASAVNLAKLRTVFKEGGTVTAGNASGINDGAAALTLMTRSEAIKRGIRPLGRLVGYAHAGVDPSRMGIGPVPAVKAALSKAGLSVSQMDVIESNEAFAAQACAVAKELGFPDDRTNPNGGAIALGHPVGATGAIIMVKLLYELQRINGRYGLATMCIGGGQGIAAIVEREA
ncbi:beta-ketothiolase BktB [Hypericibacter sp.]|uniref:beta-ketothiolase BktB n=1 Tax=Hypericibacter sp. TaxID=2705401 RepID=UPI003D6D7E8F